MFGECGKTHGLMTLAQLGKKEPRRAIAVLERARAMCLEDCKASVNECAACGENGSCATSRALLKEAIGLVKLAEDYDSGRVMGFT